MDMPKTAVIIGASRGLGLALVDEYLTRGWNVIATERGAAGTPLRERAATHAGRLTVEQLDITDQPAIAALRARLDDRRFDLLFVNAGVSNDREQTVGTVSTDDFTWVMVTNALAPMRVLEALEDLVPASGSIGVMSSGLGSVARNADGGNEIYRASKAALNTLVRSFNARHASAGRSTIIMAPGWIRTDLGGADAPFTIEQNIPRVVDVLEQYAGREGVHYVDYRGETVPW